jgi:hypothetical protein
MPSIAEAAHASPAPRALLLERLRDRLEEAAALTVDMQHDLHRGDSRAIESGTSRLETVLLEFKLLAEEHGRLPLRPGDADPAECRARLELERTATRLARSAAVTGGLLERLVRVSRKIIDTFQAAGGETYLPSGRTRETPFRGLHLREEA